MEAQSRVDMLALKAPNYSTGLGAQWLSLKVTHRWLMHETHRECRRKEKVPKRDIAP